MGLCEMLLCSQGCGPGFFLCTGVQVGDVSWTFCIFYNWELSLKVRDVAHEPFIIHKLGTGSSGERCVS